MLTFKRGAVAAISLMFVAPGASLAQDFDCAAYENYAGAEPAGYAEACLEGGPAVGSTIGGVGGAPDAPDDSALALDIRNDMALLHQQADLANSIPAGVSTRSIFALDAAADLSVIYGIDNTSREFGTFDGTALTVIANVGGIPVDDNISSLTINAATGDAYVTGLGSGGMTLYSLNLETGVLTPIGTDPAVPFMVATSINCDGVMYGHDISTDQIFTIDTDTGQASLVGPTGVASNFAQSIDFDNDTGELYAYTYQGGGNNQYGTIDLGTGALTPLNTNNPLGEFEGTSLTTCDGVGAGPARFQVTKDFDDDNPAEVDVMIQCNTGLPLSQPATISEGDGVTFVVGDFESGDLNCEITEVEPAGYSAQYHNGEIFTGASCVFEDIEAGSFHTCEISNFVDEVTVDVTKVWIDENPQFNATNYAEAYWSCQNAAYACEEGPEGAGGESCSGYLEFDGNPDTDRIYIRPSWDGGTTCTISEVNIADGGVEIDDSDCASITLFPGVGGECTIYNTRLYEGIPTLSHYGLAIMALIMLGVGLVGFRRFV